MKKFFTILIIISALILAQTMDRSNIIHSRTSGAPAGVTGSPADGQTCATIGCHAGPAAQPLPGLITSTIPPTGYVPGQTYTIMANATDLNKVKFGFQVSPQAANGIYLGTLQVTNAATTKIVSTKYITHTSGGTSGPGGMKTWSFDWVAPVAGTGDVTFYGAFNYANNNGTSSGDEIKTSTLTVMEDLSTGLASADDPFSTLVYPVPAIDRITVSMYVEAPGNTSIELISMSGRSVAPLYNNATIASGNQDLNIDLPADLSSGIYFLKLTIGDQQAIKKLIIN